MFIGTLFVNQIIGTCRDANILRLYAETRAKVRNLFPS